ncbi:hypothetical protein HYX10_02250 [Candidatus Woesearchaeota archaeon]|nr:hypothetical protein [Candidatus Woesearchaeota archaeon]
MTSLSSALREKKRYLVFEVIGNAKCSDAVAAVKGSFSRLFGSIESANADIAEVKSRSSMCMLRVGRKYADKLKAAMIMVKNINGNYVMLRSVGLSGSIKNASNYLGE